MPKIKVSRKFSLNFKTYKVVDPKTNEPAVYDVDEETIKNLDRLKKPYEVVSGKKEKEKEKEKEDKE